MDERSTNAVEGLTTRELAARWRIAIQTLKNDRCAGRGPAFVRVNRGRVLYPLADILEWEATHRVDRTREMDQARIPNLVRSLARRDSELVAAGVRAYLEEKTG